MSEPVLDAMRDLIQEDAGGRGLRTVPDDNLITACPGDLEAACRSLASTANAAVGVVTGFYIAHAEPPCGETDGPLGALFLARALTPLGIRVVLITDPFCVPALDIGLRACGLTDSVSLVSLPDPETAAELSGPEYAEWVARRTGLLTHLVALERAGPSHTAASVAAQVGADGTLDQFLTEVPPEDRDRCHSMRGRDITAFMSPAHHLFESFPGCGARPVTIGIGDGGNEIGMGKLSWSLIRRNIPRGGLVACRVPTDWLIVAGVSNWGAYALAAGTRYLRDAPCDRDLFDPARELDLLRRMVEHGPLVDGTSGRPTATVDGLPFERYAAVLVRLCELSSCEGP